MSDDPTEEAREDDSGERPRPRDTDPPTGGDTSDDTTQADAGMVGGTGAVPAEGTRQPLGTEPLTDETREPDR